MSSLICNKFVGYKMFYTSLIHYKCVYIHIWFPRRIPNGMKSENESSLRKEKKKLFQTFKGHFSKKKL